MTSKLSDYFTMDEMTISDYAVRHGIDNSIPPELLSELIRTATETDKVRRLLGRPVVVLSGYRTPALNEAIGSKGGSQHPKAEAVDFICPGFGTPQEVFDKIRVSGLDFDQLIVELGRWVHISFGSRRRRQCLSYDGTGYREVR